MEDKITPEKLAKYFETTRKALEKAKTIPEKQKEGEIILDMAQRYYKDAKYFEEQKNIVTAFAALNYAHGWLDTGARLEILDVDRDSILFTVD